MQFILLSRYVFIFLITLFLWHCAAFVFSERGYNIGNQKREIIFQRVEMLLMLLLAFFILSYDFDLRTMDWKVCRFAGYNALALSFIWLSTDKIYKNSDRLMWNIITFLMETGIIMLYRLKPVYAEKQLLWIVVALLVTLLVPLILKIISRFEKLEILYLLCGWTLFIATYICADETNGSRNWIVFENGFGFQPSEIIKFLFIFYLASVFRKERSLKRYVFCTIMSAGYVLALVLQKDLGAALIFFMTYVIMFYISTISEWLVALGMLLFSGLSVAAYKIFPHIRVRFQIWKNPWLDPEDSGYQIVQSIFAIGTYGFIGSGLTLGSPKSIPVVESDFIFSAIAEEFGGIFAIGLIAIFLVFFYRGINIALRCNKKFYSLISAGIINMLALQTFLILGGVTKLIPLTGVTLPFVSYGGSSMLVSVIMVGFLQWIYSHYKMQREEGLSFGRN